MKNFLIFINTKPLGIFIGTIANIIALLTNTYNKAFDNNIFNFILCEFLIILVYLLLYLHIKNNKI